MINYDNDLLQLQQKVALKKQLEAKLHDLRKQRSVFDKRVGELRIAHCNEQEDVEKLEGRSLSKYFFQLFGQLDEKLDKERAEASAARVKLDAAQRELAAVDHDIRELQEQLQALHGCEGAYSAALEAKRNAVKAAHTPTANRILELEEKIALQEIQKMEIQEAITAGRSAMKTADSILAELDEADGWNTWDMLGGGSISAWAKHSCLDEAQEKVEQLQGKLRRFQTELADINIHADMQVSIDGFLRFADYFFDSLFTDWAIGDKINESQSSVKRVKSQIRSALSKLESMEQDADAQICQLNTKIEELLVSG